MFILGILGSPRVGGTCSQLLQKSLAGAESKNAITKQIDLINLNIKFCRGCGTCYLNAPELKVGNCPLDDDMASILDDYIKADGYVFASPVYDGYVTALMKMFLERKIALTYKSPDEPGKIPGSRFPAEFKKRASMIVTGNCSDEFREVMGDPCFEGMGAHLGIEQIMTTDQLYVGGLEILSEEAFAQQLEKAFDVGVRLVDDIAAAQRDG